MSRHYFRTRVLDDVEKLLPGFRKVWPQIKAVCRTTARCPKSVCFTDSAERVIADDHDCAKRFALDLRTMELSESRDIGCGEWAVHAGSNNDQAITEIPGTHAVVTCVYNGFYRTFSMTVQVAKLPEQFEVR